ncbi:hypothetical protein [Streptomyces sp. SBT349]|uniref:hypothetical protein n=1 Tax=Streptomyces sp. SBT349 TaxID=1580539 RepID=UPI0007C6999B|nr:hypothetical protein [Streptomyces sp. SBT349]
MSALLSLLVIVAGLAVIMGGFAWLASHVRRRGVVGSALGAAMASHDEAFRPTAHDSHYEIRAQAERKAPILSPDHDARDRSGLARRSGVDAPRPRRHPRRRLRRFMRRLTGR